LAILGLSAKILQPIQNLLTCKEKHRANKNKSTRGQSSTAKSSHNQPSKGKYRRKGSMGYSPVSSFFFFFFSLFKFLLYSSSSSSSERSSISPFSRHLQQQKQQHKQAQSKGGQTAKRNKGQRPNKKKIQTKAKRARPRDKRNARASILIIIKKARARQNIGSQQSIRKEIRYVKSGLALSCNKSTRKQRDKKKGKQKPAKKKCCKRFVYRGGLRFFFFIFHYLYF